MHGMTVGRVCGDDYDISFYLYSLAGEAEGKHYYNTTNGVNYMHNSFKLG